MNRRRRLLVVLACVGCLLAVASALPAADPRLEAPGGESTAGEWDAVVGEPTPAADLENDPDGERSGEDGHDSDDRSDGTGGSTDGIELSGSLEPGNEVTVELEEGASHFDPPTIEVNGERVGEPTPFGRLDGVEVPYAETMTVTVPDRDLSATFEVRTDATVRLHDPAAPGADVELSAAVGSTPVHDATVSVDGEATGTTDADGRTTVTLPDRAGETDITVERGPITGTETVSVVAPTASFASPLLVPGSLAPVRVTADGGGVPNATVAVVGGGEAAAHDAMGADGAAAIDEGHVTSTDDAGNTRVWLPLDDEATLIATAGGETTTTTVENLYLRLTAVLVVVPGLVIGGVIGYLRLARRFDHEPGNEFAVLFVGLAEMFATLGSVIRLPSPSVPDLSWPALRIPTGLGRSIGAAVAGVLTSLGSVPSIGSVTRSTRRGVGSLVRSGAETVRRGSADDDEGTGGTGIRGEPLGPESPRRTVRAAWHTFCDRVGVRRRESRSPGEVARQAIEAGYPAETVNDLLSTLRDVEYGGHRATPDRAVRAHDTAADLVEYDPDERDGGRSGGGPNAADDSTAGSDGGDP